MKKFIVVFLTLILVISLSLFSLFNFTDVISDTDPNFEDHKIVDTEVPCTPWPPPDDDG